MNKPTRGQRRAFILLASLFAIWLILLIFKPFAKYKPNQANPLSLQQQVEHYGVEIEKAANEHKKSWKNSHKRKYYNKSYYKYDTTRSEYRKNKYVRQPIPTIELNSADTTQLKMLPGIGSVFANRIVKYRSLLGGFVYKEQLLEVYGMDEERYTLFADKIIMDTSAIEKIDINNASVKKLKKHPYIDYYQARAINDFREKVGKVKNSDDLMKITLLDEKTINKIAPYIKYY